MSGNILIFMVQRVWYRVNVCTSIHIYCSNPAFSLQESADMKQLTNRNHLCLVAQYMLQDNDKEGTRKIADATAAAYQ